MMFPPVAMMTEPFQVDSEAPWVQSTDVCNVLHEDLLELNTFSRQSPALSLGQDLPL